MDLLEFLRSFVSDHKLGLFDRTIEHRTRRLTVVLEDLYQSHNASAVLRSCDCFGIQDVHIIENRNEWTTHKDIERGSAKWLTLHRYNESSNNSAQCMQSLKAEGYHLVATSPHADRTLDQIPVDRPLALVFGTEKEGVSQTVFDHCEFTCRIPMYGFTESFNISVAAAVCLHTLRAKMEKSGVDLSLDPTEKAEILATWCKQTLRNPHKYEEAYHRRFGP